MVLACMFVYNNSYLEHLFVLEATGEPIPTLNLKTHAFFCMVMLIIALMPDAQPGGKPHAD